MPFADPKFILISKFSIEAAYGPVLVFGQNIFSPIAPSFELNVIFSQDWFRPAICRCLRNRIAAGNRCHKQLKLYVSDTDIWQV
jgi:hypothetical protein